MTEPESTPVVIEVTVAAPIETVWASLRDPDLIRLWHGWHYDELDHEIGVIYAEGVQADEGNHSLQLGDGDRFELTEGEHGTVVRVVRAPYVPDTEWSAYYADITEGWTSFLQQLKFMHERHPGEFRRTIFLSGSGPADALARLAASLPVEAGEDAFRAENQRGVVLPELGPGLLIVAGKPGVDDQGNQVADAMAIVTAYGVAEQDFPAEVDRWTAWWRSGYPTSDPAQV